MRTEAQVKRRLHQVVWKYLKLRYSRLLSKRPENCKFYLLRQRRSGEARAFCVWNDKDGSIGRLCLFEDDPDDCPHFALKWTREQIRLDLERDIKRVGFKRHNMKDLVQLEWVLELDDAEAGELESKFVDEFIAWMESTYKKRGFLAWLKSLFVR